MLQITFGISLWPKTLRNLVSQGNNTGDLHIANYTDPVYQTETIKSVYLVEQHFSGWMSIVMKVVLLN